MNSRLAWRRMWLLCLLAWLTSCDGPTEILVRVRSELPEGSIQSVTLHVTFADGSTDEKTLEKLPFVAAIGPQGGSGEVLVTTTASGPIGTLTDEARVRFSSGKSLLLDVEFRERCLAPACEADESCRGCGGCQPIERSSLPSVQGSVDADEPLLDCSLTPLPDAGADVVSTGPMDSSTSEQITDQEGGSAQQGSTGQQGQPDAGGNPDVVTALEDSGVMGGSGDAMPNAGSPDGGATPPEHDCVSRACVKSISLGDVHGCFVAADKGLYCWGESYYGQLGRGELEPGTYGIERVPNFGNWESISAEGTNTCGTNNEGGLLCWGQTLGDLFLDRPELARGTSPFAAVESGMWWGCGVTTEAGIECWGIYDGIDFGAVVKVPEPGAGAGWRAMADCFEEAYLIDDANRLWKWASSTLEQQESGVRDAVLVGPTCILFENGRLRCQGVNDAGQVGNGATSVRSAEAHYVEVPGVQWKALGGSSDATCAISQQGDVWCWGSNQAGAMGVSPEEQPTVASPRMVAAAPKGDPYVEVEVGVKSVCALRESSWVDCWGGEAPQAFGLTPAPLLIPGSR